MKPFFVLFVALLPLVATSGALSTYAQSASMVPVSSVTGGFSVMMPEYPQYATRPITTVSGHQVTQHLYSVTSPDGRFAYFVAYNDYPFALGADGLNRVCAGQAEGMKGLITRQEDITVSGYRGRMVRIEGNDFVSVSKSIIVGRRLYQVIFVMAIDSTVPPEAARFLNSFRIEF